MTYKGKMCGMTFSAPLAVLAHLFSRPRKERYDQE